MPDTIKTPKETDKHEQRAGLQVTTISIWIVGAIVAVLLAEIILVEIKFAKPDMTTSLSTLCDKNCTPEFVRLLMDQDAQLLRTDRVRTTMVSRLMIFIVAEVVALMLVSLGAVLIFNRIENTKESSTINYRDWFFSTSFPGLIMCGMGAAVLASSLFLASSSGLLVTIYDRPVYTKDANFIRNAMGINSGQAPGGTEENPSHQQPDISFSAFPPDSTDE